MAQGKYYQPTLHVEDINATPRTYISQDVNLSVTVGCPCDTCDIKEGCKTECFRFKYWVIKGPSKQQKAAYLASVKQYAKVFSRCNKEGYDG